MNSNFTSNYVKQLQVIRNWWKRNEQKSTAFVNKREESDTT